MPFDMRHEIGPAHRPVVRDRPLLAPVVRPPDRRLVMRARAAVADDLLFRQLARSVDRRQRGDSGCLAPATPAGPATPPPSGTRAAIGAPTPPASGLVIARMPLPTTVRQPGPMLLRDDGDVDEQEPEGWGAWALRQSRNPWVWAGIGLGVGIAGLVYYNQDAIGDAIKGEALKHPELLTTGAKILGPDRVADMAGSYISSSLKEMAEQSSISSLSVSDHLSDVGDALVKVVPGGGLVNMGIKVAQGVADNEQLLRTGLEVAQRLGPEFVLDVVKKVAVDHGGDIALSTIEIATKPMYESAGWVYSHIGSNHW
jgi:hypothetical protein